MTSSSTIHCEVVQILDNLQPFNVFVVCMDRSDMKHNIIDNNFGLDLLRAVILANKKASSGEIDIVVVCSAKHNSFMAGADILHELKYVGVEGACRSYKDSCKLQHIFCALESLPVPSIAILNGTTLGGGLELALACDFRVADEQSKQIGLPEVKIGVLPGGGGCIRLPRLIGFRRSLGLLVTGRSITAQKALHLGIVDALIPNTKCCQKSSMAAYEYAWLLDILEFVKQKDIVKSAVNSGFKKVHDVCPPTISSLKDEEILSLTEDEINSTFKPWSEYDVKPARKYKSAQNIVSFISGFVINLFVCFLALIEIWKNVGLKMPAPYICLLTTLRCYYSGSWMEAMMTNAVGFATVASTTESKSLMSLFLSTRRLKKVALCIGNETDRNSYDPSDVKLKTIVLISKMGLKFSAPVIQGLLYKGLSVNVVNISGKFLRSVVIHEIRELFSYSVNRGYITSSAVDDYIDQLRFYSESDVDYCDGDLIIDASFGVCGSAKNTIISGNPSKVYIDLKAGCHTTLMKDIVIMNLGDPIRNNTLCVEVFPANREYSSGKLRVALSLVSAMGKIPIILPPSTNGSVSLYLTLCHWNMAVSVVGSKRWLTEKAVDHLLRTAGFTKGVFETMRELDPDYLFYMASTYEDELFNPLKTYLSCSRTVNREHRHKLTKAELVELFLLNLSSYSLKIKRTNQNISEAAIDVLCVSSLIHYPPSEGGPLSYFVRNGGDSCTSKLRSLCASVSPPFPIQLEEFAAVECVLFDEVINSSDTFISPKTDFREIRSEGNFLRANELRAIGPSHGILNKEMFLIIFGYDMLFLFLGTCFLVLCACFLACCYFFVL